MNPINYRYDGQHLRIVAQVHDGGSVEHTRYFHHSAQWQVIEERVDEGSNGNEGDVERQFVWGLEYVDELVVRFRDTTGNEELDETLYILCDTNYRITAVVTTAGAVAERYVYSPYGQRTVLNDDWSLHNDATFGDFEFHYGHQGLRHDPETGLVENRNRIYIPPLGRFGQTDPLNQNEAGGGYQDGMNLYQYLRSNPSQYFDPDGLACRVWYDCVLVSEDTSGLTRTCKYDCLEDTSKPRQETGHGVVDCEDDRIPGHIRHRRTTLRCFSCGDMTRTMRHWDEFPYRPTGCSRSACRDAAQDNFNQAIRVCGQLRGPQQAKCVAIAAGVLELALAACNLCDDD